MEDIIHLIQTAVEVGWPFVLTAIVIALALHVRETQNALIAELKDRVLWLEQHCLEAPKVDDTPLF